MAGKYGGKRRGAGRPRKTPLGAETRGVSLPRDLWRRIDVAARRRPDGRSAWIAAALVAALRRVAHPRESD